MNTLEMAYHEGVKLAMVQHGLIKEAGPTQELLELARRSQLPKGPLGARLMDLLHSIGGGAKTLAANPMAQRGAGGALAGGLAGGLTGDEDSDTLARILGGGALGAGAGVASVPAEQLAKKLIASGRMAKGLRGMGRELEGRARAGAPTPEGLLQYAD